MRKHASKQGWLVRVCPDCEHLGDDDLTQCLQCSAALSLRDEYLIVCPECATVTRQAVTVCPLCLAALTAADREWRGVTEAQRIATEEDLKRRLEFIRAHPASKVDPEFERGLTGLTLYDLVGLDVTATSREVRRIPPWVWFPARGSRAPEPSSRAERELFQRRHAEARSTLIHPPSRAAHDRRLVSVQELTQRISEKVGWGEAWAIGFGFLALLMFVAHEDISRFLGINFAPDFQEVRVIDEQSETGEVISRFFSSDARWEHVLNSLAVSIPAAAVMAVIANIGYRCFDRLAARAVVATRLSGREDTFMRRTLWAVVLVPMAGTYLLLLSCGLVLGCPPEF